MRLKNRVALITGSGRGIGEAIAVKFAQSGADLVLCDVDLASVVKVAEKARTFGIKAIPVQVDISNWEDVQRMRETVLNEFGKLDILVNNSGVTQSGFIQVYDLSEEEWNKMMNVNLKGTFFCCKAFVKAMMEQGGGAIVNLGSIAGKEGNPGLSAYSASKAGVMCFTQTLAKEVASYNVRVNSVAPALTKTPMLDSASEEELRFLAVQIPLGRLGKPEEIAAVVEFLASDDASFVTGQCYNVTGGRGSY